MEAAAADEEAETIKLACSYCQIVQRQGAAAVTRCRCGALPWPCRSGLTGKVLMVGTTQ